METFSRRELLKSATALSTAVSLRAKATPVHHPDLRFPTQVPGTVTNSANSELVPTKPGYFHSASSPSDV